MRGTRPAPHQLERERGLGSTARLLLLALHQSYCTRQIDACSLPPAPAALARTPCPALAPRPPAAASACSQPASSPSPRQSPRRSTRSVRPSWSQVATTTRPRTAASGSPCVATLPLVLVPRPSPSASTPTPPTDAPPPAQQLARNADGKGEPLNAVVILDGGANDDLFDDWSLSINFGSYLLDSQGVGSYAGECLGQSDGARQAANLGDGQGMRASSSRLAFPPRPLCLPSALPPSPAFAIFLARTSIVLSLSPDIAARSRQARADRPYLSRLARSLARRQSDGSFARELRRRDVRRVPRKRRRRLPLPRLPTSRSRSGLWGLLHRGLGRAISLAKPHDRPQRVRLSLSPSLDAPRRPFSRPLPSFAVARRPSPTSPSPSSSLAVARYPSPTLDVLNFLLYARSYDLGRDEVVRRATVSGGTKSPVTNRTFETTASNASGPGYFANVSIDEINHGIATDGVVAVLSVKVTSDPVAACVPSFRSLPPSRSGPSLSERSLSPSEQERH